MNKFQNRFLKNYPYYVILLPIFFIIHGLKENFEYVSITDLALILIFYVCCAICLFIISFLIYRNRNKAGLMPFLLLSMFFFFGALQDFLNNYIPGLSRYIILMPLFLLVLITAGILLKRTNNPLTRLTFFLNTLFIIYLIFDFSIITFYSFSKKEHTSANRSVFIRENFKPCNECKKPDIYFLLFDEYTSSLALKNYFRFENSALDSFLVKNRFQIQKNSFSNYNYTPFSMASIMNMAYLDNIPDGYAFGNAEYYNCFEQVKQSEFVKLLSKMGYDIVNYSIFDLPGHPTQLRADAFTAKTRLLTDQTLWGRIQKNVLWNLFTGKFEIKLLTKNSIFEHLDADYKTVELLKNEIGQKKSSPRFVYAHFMIPHPPYYFDSLGRVKPRNEIIHVTNERDCYLNNIKYVNNQIYKIVSDILKQSNGEAAIIVMGDHGFRYDPAMPKPLKFKNLNAVYLPDKNYKLFYDSMSAVNEFRTLSNTLFNMNIPILKDSTKYLMGTLQ